VDADRWLGNSGLVIANILAGPLIDLSQTLLDFLRPGGVLLLSGLLASQADDLRNHYCNRIELSVSGEKEGWVCLRGTLPG
jgi:ribosomal protein L11 methyltransferase